jgi:hypothetical protein
VGGPAAEDLREQQRAGEGEAPHERTMPALQLSGWANPTMKPSGLRRKQSR